MVPSPLPLLQATWKVPAGAWERAELQHILPSSLSPLLLLSAFKW